MVSNKFILLFLVKINYSKGQTERVPDGVDKSLTIIEEKSRSCRGSARSCVKQINEEVLSLLMLRLGKSDRVTRSQSQTAWRHSVELTVRNTGRREAESLRNAQTELQQSLTNPLPLQTNVNGSQARRRRQSFFLDNVLISEKELTTINFVNVF